MIMLENVRPARFRGVDMKNKIARSCHENSLYDSSG